MIISCLHLSFVTVKAECYLSNIASIPKSDSNPDTPAFPSIVSVLHWGHVIFSGWSCIFSRQDSQKVWKHPCRTFGRSKLLQQCQHLTIPGRFPPVVPESWFRHAERIHWKSKVRNKIFSYATIYLRKCLKDILLYLIHHSRQSLL